MRKLGTFSWSLLVANCPFHLQPDTILKRDETREVLTEDLIHGTAVFEYHKSKTAVPRWSQNVLTDYTAVLLKPCLLHLGDLAEKAMQSILVHVLWNAAHEHLSSLCPW